LTKGHRRSFIISVYERKKCAYRWKGEEVKKTLNAAQDIVKFPGESDKHEPQDQILTLQATRNGNNYSTYLKKSSQLVTDFLLGQNFAATSTSANNTKSSLAGRSSG
jgi:hypothetical protein